MIPRNTDTIGIPRCVAPHAPRRDEICAGIDCGHRRARRSMAATGPPDSDGAAFDAAYLVGVLARSPTLTLRSASSAAC